MHPQPPTPGARVPGCRLRRLSRPHAWLRRVTASTTAGGMLLFGLPLAMDYVVRPGDTLSQIAVRHDTTVERLVARNGLDHSGDRIIAGQLLHVPAAHRRAAERRAPNHDGARRVVRYTVRRGDTPSGLAVRFHAWTAELIARNGSVLRVGDRIEIPVVVAAAARARRAGNSGTASPHTPRAHRPQAGPSRAAVRRVITRTALRNGVDPELALAIAWQESGWQMHHVSRAGAIGAMQVMPSTGHWISKVVGRRLRLRDLEDNATAGVLLLGILQDQVHLKRAVAGYYQGLDGVRRHGMYADTKHYVADVLALRHRFSQGDYPA